MTRREMLEWLIDENVVGHRRAKRNRDILRSRFLDGDTIEEIAEKFDMSETQISRIIHRYGDPLLIKLSKMTG